MNLVKRTLTCYLNSNHSILANFLHGRGDQFSNSLVSISRNCCNLQVNFNHVINIEFPKKCMKIRSLRADKMYYNSTWAISSGVVTGLDIFFKFSTTASTASMTPEKKKYIKICLSQKGLNEDWQASSKLKKNKRSQTFSKQL